MVKGVEYNGLDFGGARVVCKPQSTTYSDVTVRDYAGPQGASFFGSGTVAF